MSRTAALLTALCVSPLLALASQARPAIAPGDRVRITTADWELVGTLVTQGDDSLRLQVTGEVTPVSVARSAIKRLEIARSHSNTGTDALIGLGAGALVGGTLGAVAGSDLAGECPGNDCGAAPAVFGGLLMGALGAGVGAVIGSLSHSEQWDSVPPHGAP